MQLVKIILALLLLIVFCSISAQTNAIDQNNKSNDVDYYTIGKDAASKRDYETAIENFKQSEIILLKDSIANVDSLGKIYNSIGSAYTNLSNFDLALSYLEKSKLHRKENSIGLAKTYLNIGRLNQKMQKYDAALNAYLYALGIVENEDDIVVPKLYNNLGSIYYMTDQYEEAEAYYRKAVLHPRISEQSKKRARNNLALILVERGEYDDAKSFYLKNLQQHRLDDNIYGIALTHFNLGHLYYRSEEFSSALSSFQEALKWNRLAKDNELEQDILRSMIDNFYMLNEVDSALLYVDTLQLRRDEFSEEVMEGVIFREHLQDEKLRRSEETITTQRRNNLLVALTLLFFIAILSSIFYSVFMRNRRKIAQQEKMIIQAKHDVIDTRLRTIEEEQERLSTTLHSSICNLLIGTRMQFQLLGRKIDKLEEGTRKRYEEAYDLLEESYEETRKASSNLNDLILRQRGLEAQLQHFVRGFRSATPTRIDLNIEGLKEGTDNDIAQKVYRILQELITNALKYADADSIQVALTQIEDELHIRVKDDGKGLPSSKSKSGTGLARIRKDVSHLGGQMKIVTDDGKGTLIDIQSIHLN